MPYYPANEAEANDITDPYRVVQSDDDGIFTDNTALESTSPQRPRLASEGRAQTDLLHGNDIYSFMSPERIKSSPYNRRKLT